MVSVELEDMPSSLANRVTVCGSGSGVGTGSLWHEVSAIAATKAAKMSLFVMILRLNGY